MPPNYSYMLSVINSHINIGAAVVINNYGVLQKEFWKIVRGHVNKKLFKIP